MRIVSLFSGLGGLDIACERAFGGVTVTQVEREPFAIRLLERRWPDAVRHDDVTTYRGEPCDVICGGFPCTDLSVAGKREGLDAARSGLYHEMMRIVGEALPQYVVVENVPPLLQYRGRLDTDFARLGYGTIWQVCEASDVGAPHRRQRVFVVAVRGLAGSQMLPRPSTQGELFLPAFGGDKEEGRRWLTPLCQDSMHSGYEPANQKRNMLCVQVTRAGHAAKRPTPTTGDHATMYQQGGEPLGHAARWPTPRAQEPGATRVGYGRGLAELMEGKEQRAWPTPAARDYKDSGHEPSAQARNSPCLPASAVMDADQAPGVLNPAWVDLLMGLPSGWTDLDASPDLTAHRWPAGRGEPQHADEPPRLVPPKSVPKRSARLKALGNAVVWQQAEAAIRRALEVAR